MKIAIIGGGWVGCHLANILGDDHDVTIFEKNNELFKETSFYNQNRLHAGYHYARNQKTRKLCEDTFDRFLDAYGFLVKDVPKNYYCIPLNESLIDFGTFKKIYQDYDHKEVDLDFLTSIEGSVTVKEKYIDYNLAKKYFNKTLKHLVEKRKVLYPDIYYLSREFDLVINCTNNFLKDNSCSSAFYELALTLVYERIKKLPFDAVTLVDGDFFSIYPYYKNMFTVSDVEFTPVARFSEADQLKSVNITLLYDNVRKNVENKIVKYFPEFKNYFSYNSYFISVKSKYMNQSADRYPVINCSDNIISTFTGKIQGIFIIEDYVKKYING